MNASLEGLYTQYFVKTTCDTCARLKSDSPLPSEKVSTDSWRMEKGSRYSCVVLFEKLDDSNIVFEGDNVRLRKGVQLWHVRL